MNLSRNPVKWTYFGFSSLSSIFLVFCLSHFYVKKGSPWCIQSLLSWDFEAWAEWKRSEGWSAGAFSTDSCYLDSRSCPPFFFWRGHFFELCFQLSLLFGDLHNILTRISFSASVARISLSCWPPNNPWGTLLSTRNIFLYDIGFGKLNFILKLTV